MVYFDVDKPSARGDTFFTYRLIPFGLIVRSSYFVACKVEVINAGVVGVEAEKELSGLAFFSD